MIKDTLSLKEVLVSFEGTLCIEYSDDMSTQQTLDQALARLESAYEIVIDKDLFSLQVENALVGEKTNMLLHDITECLKQMALFLCISMYTKSVGISLADVNYLGNDKEVVKTYLRYLQDASESEKWASSLEPIALTLDNVPICYIKRLFTVLLMLHKLGVYEGVAILATYLYMGGLVS